jgi:sugar phosphate permease
MPLARSKSNYDNIIARFYDLATGDDDARLCRDIPDAQCREQPQNFLLQTAALALSKIGDALADTKVILPWLIGAVGGPAFLIGFLVPVRESLALLPQIIVGGVIRHFAVRKFFWTLSSLVQGLCVIAMGLIGLSDLPGTTAGWSIFALVAIFSLARGIASIASKDTLGKTVSKGRRGRVNGYAATISGVVATALGAYLLLVPAAARPDGLLAGIVIGGGVCWLLAAAVFQMIDEHPGATDGGRGLKDLLLKQADLLREDPELRKFLIARTFMISTALVAPMYVALAQNALGNDIQNLGWLILASGLASATSSQFWGAFSDVSSRATMALAAAIAGALGFVVVAISTWAPALIGHIGFFAVVLFVLGISHSGVRIGRKTHIVDLAGKDQKSEYVALSNTLIGVLLLVIGGLSGSLLILGLEITILALSALSLVGAATAAKMANTQA